MSLQDVVILLLGVGLVATWVLGARMMRRLATELDEIVRDRVEHDELQTSVGRTLGQLQVAADNLADALATRTERLNELLAQADAQSAMLGDAISVAAALTERLGAEAAALNQIAARSHELEYANMRADAAVASAEQVGAYSNGSSNASSSASSNGSANGAPRVRDDSVWASPIVPTLAVTEAASPVAPSYSAVGDAEVAPAPASADEVRRLARDGVDLATIARRTNRGREEVRLLLRFAGSTSGSEGRRGPSDLAEQATLTPGTFRRPNIRNW